MTTDVILFLCHRTILTVFVTYIRIHYSHHSVGCAVTYQPQQQQKIIQTNDPCLLFVIENSTLLSPRKKNRSIMNIQISLKNTSFPRENYNSNDQKIRYRFLIENASDGNAETESSKKVDFVF